jgi:hypothetical protein
MAFPISTVLHEYVRNLLTHLKANEHHRKHLESLPETAYPLVAQGDAAEIPESHRITDEALGQR